MRCLIVSLMLVLCPTLALAEPAARAPAKQAPGKQTAKTAPVQELRFDDDTVEAGRATGAGDVITGVKRPKHSSLISIRTSFVPELIKSAEDL